MPLPPGTARPVVAAGALFRDAAGRVLLVHPTYERGSPRPTSPTTCRHPCAAG